MSPTRKVTSHSSGMEAKNFKSSARPLLFSNTLKSGSSQLRPAIIIADVAKTVSAISAAKMFQTAKCLPMSAKLLKSAARNGGKLADAADSDSR